MNATKTVHHVPGGTVTTYRPLNDSPNLTQTDRSVLRYPGGKSRAVKAIRKHIGDVSDLCAPFLGGASVELSCASDGIQVYGADAFQPLINFWKQAKDDPVEIARRVKAHHPVSREKFYSLQKGYHAVTDSLERAAIFYVLNRCSFSGTTLSGGMSPNHPRFTPSSIERLRRFRADNLHVTCADFEETVEAHSDKLLYLDPPYANGEQLYGNRGDMHDGFDHERLASLLKKRDGWILSYNDHPLIEKLYSGYHFDRPTWQYGMSNDKRSSEVLIINA